LPPGQQEVEFVNQVVRHQDLIQRAVAVSKDLLDNPVIPPASEAEVRPIRNEEAPVAEPQLE